MECTTSKNRVIDTLIEVNKVSVAEKTNKQDSINKFLDKILEVKQDLTRRADDLSSINEKVGRVTWVQNLTDEELETMRKIIDLLDRIIVSDKKYFIKVSTFISRSKISPHELSLFKISLDDLIERRQDLNDRFFSLPDDDEFMNDLKELESL